MRRELTKIIMTLLLLASCLNFSRPAVAADRVETTLTAAHQAAHDNANSEAARLFAEAIAEDPSRRLEILPDLSDQLTYSGKAADAVALYREVLRSKTLHGDAIRHSQLGLALALSWSHRLTESLHEYNVVLLDHPNDIEALLGHARVESWKDELTPALHEYQHILAIEPENGEAREGLANVENWRGRRRDAQVRAKALLAQNRDNVAASITLAQSELWMGRPDLARRVDNTILRGHPNDASARSLADDITANASARMQESESIGTQSDGLLIRTFDLEAEGRSNDGLTSFGVRYQPISYQSHTTTGSASERKIGPFIRSRLNDWSEINASVSQDDISSSGNPNHQVTLYDSYLTLWPSDTFRFDIGSRRETFDNLSSLGKGITAIGNTLSMDVTPDENTRFTVRSNVGNFSDGNRRAFEQIEFERTALREPRLSFGVRGTGYTFRDQLNNGYFDPARYRSLELTTHVYGNFNRRIYYDAAASFGREWVIDDGTRPTHTIHGALSYVLSRNLSVSGVYDSFDTRQQISNSGFARSVLGIRFQTQW